MILAIYLILYLSIFLFDFLPVIKVKKINSILAYSVFYISSIVILFLHEINVNVPSPTDAIEYFINDILNLY